MSMTPPPIPPPMPPVGLNYAAPVRNDLRPIALRQKGVILCILAYFVLVLLQFTLPPELRWVLGIAALGVSITAMVFVFMLALTVYSTGLGILLGILTLVPLLGLLVLLMVNGKATEILRAHGVKIGLLGADMRQIPQ